MMIRFIKIWQSTKAKTKKNKVVDFNSDELEFLPAALEVLETPVNTRYRAIPLIIVAVFLASFIFVYITRVDVVVVSRGKVLPSTKVKTLEASIDGEIKTIHAIEGQSVKIGQLLLELDDTV